MSEDVVLIGIGQSLRGDDAAGLHAVRDWSSKYARLNPQIRIEIAEVPGLGLLNLMIGYRYALLVDAVMSGKPAGTIHRIQDSKVNAFSAGTQSAHGWGLPETLAMGKSLYPTSMPDKTLILGIEIVSPGMGESISPEVARALPELVSVIEAEIQCLLKAQAG